MPIWLRNFTYKKIEEYYRKKNESVEEQENIISNTTNIDKISRTFANVHMKKEHSFFEFLNDRYST